jgi:hypothetical protein
VAATDIDSLAAIRSIQRHSGLLSTAATTK